ncbi:MAG TPA: hypothetical protein DCG72_06310 [Gammaproteobacteria bacterium]|nr:hypothetical protein [Gammaproteobacteria bacterium]
MTKTNPIPVGTPITGNVSKHLDSRFLNSLLLAGILQEKNINSLAVKIDRVEHLDTLKYETGQTDKDVVLLYFNGSDKPLKLCKTNLRRLIAQLGPMGSDWNGKEINLCIEQCRRPDLGGKLGDCIRILGERL